MLVRRLATVATPREPVRADEAPTTVDPHPPVFEESAQSAARPVTREESARVPVSRGPGVAVVATVAVLAIGAAAALLVWKRRVEVTDGSPAPSTAPAAQIASLAPAQPSASGAPAEPRAQASGAPSAPASISVQTARNPLRLPARGLAAPSSTPSAPAGPPPASSASSSRGKPFTEL
jgi:hypothetical protein